jgi:hypothetical protein
MVMAMSSKKPFLVAPTVLNIGGLGQASVPNLQQAYRELFGSGVPAGNTELARRRVAWRLQANAEGDLPESARTQAFSIARSLTRRTPSKRTEAEGPTISSRLPTGHDSRLPMPGSVLHKQYGGRRLLIRVLSSDFEWEGKRFASLSAVAQAITGTKWNGFAFFGLTKGGARGS